MVPPRPAGLQRVLHPSLQQGFGGFSRWRESDGGTSRLNGWPRRGVWKAPQETLFLVSESTLGFLLGMGSGLPGTP